MKKLTIIEIIAYLYIILFLYTGISKMIEYTLFKEQIAASPILAFSAPLVARVLPIIEIALAIILFLPSWRKIGLIFSLVLVTIFTIYISLILMVDKQIPCSCGGVIELLSWKQHLVFNFALITMAIVAIILENKITQLNRLLNL